MFFLDIQASRISSIAFIRNLYEYIEIMIYEIIIIIMDNIANRVD